jgi:hypothetical protein
VPSKSITPTQKQRWDAPCSFLFSLPRPWQASVRLPTATRTAAVEVALMHQIVFGVFTVTPYVVWCDPVENCLMFSQCRSSCKGTKVYVTSQCPGTLLLRKLYLFIRNSLAGPDFFTIFITTAFPVVAVICFMGLLTYYYLAPKPRPDHTASVAWVQLSVNEYLSYHA